jgi:hypothetical protein
MNIANEISEALLNDNYRKLPDYCSFLFDVVIKKCMIDEAFSKDYIRFLFGFKDNIANHLSENVKKFIEEATLFLTSNKSLKEYSYFHYVKDTALWRNVGVIVANMYKSLNGNARIGQINININIVNNLEAQFDILFNILDWLPSNMDELNGRLYMVFAIMESLSDEIWGKFSDKSRGLFKEILTLAYNCANIPNKIKFKVLDLQDMIKNIKIFPAASTTASITASTTASTTASIVMVEKNKCFDSVELQKDNISNTKLEISSTLSNNPNSTPNSTPKPKPNPINIWEAKKQQVSTNPIQNHEISTTQPSQPSQPSHIIKSPMSSSNVKEINNSNRTNKNLFENNKEDYTQLGSGSSRNRKHSHGRGFVNHSRDINVNVNVNVNVNKKVVEEPKTKNQEIVMMIIQPEGIV